MHFGIQNLPQVLLSFREKGKLGASVFAFVGGVCGLGVGAQNSRCGFSCNLQELYSSSVENLAHTDCPTHCILSVALPAQVRWPVPPVPMR